MDTANTSESTNPRTNSAMSKQGSIPQASDSDASTVPSSQEGTTNQSSKRMSLIQLEQDHENKNKSRSSSRRCVVVKPRSSRSRINMESMERDAAVKSRETTARTAAYSIISNAEDAVSAKLRKEVLKTSPSSMRSKNQSAKHLFRSNSNDDKLLILDDRINAKVAASGLSTEGSFRSGLTSSRMKSTRSELTFDSQGSIRMIDSDTNSCGTDILSDVAAKMQQISSVSRFDLNALGSYHSSQVALRDKSNGQGSTIKQDESTFPSFLSDDFECHSVEPQTFDIGKEYEGSIDKIVEQGINSKKVGSAPVQDVEVSIFDSEKRKGLAVAFAVSETDDKYIPAAVEFDPDAKPPLLQNRRFRLYSLLICLVFVIAIVAILGGLAVGREMRNSTDNAPEVPEIPYRETIGIRAQIARVVGSDKLDDPSNPYAKALQWITHEDPMMSVPTQQNFIQRYVSSYVYFALSASRPWVTCAKPLPNETDNCIYNKLVNVKNEDQPSMNSINWIRWLSNSSECQWAGVSCDENDQIISIEISGMNVTGTVPDGLVFLPYLESINFCYGELFGTLPSNLLQLNHLSSVELQANRLTGKIPEEWFLSQSLQRLNLGLNALGGTIPSSISQAKNIKAIFFFSNMLSGTIPSEIADLKRLQNLRLDANLLEGTIPSIGAKGRQEDLYQVLLNKNYLTGPIPSSLWEATDLLEVYLGRNLLTGTIPDSCYHATTLTSLNLMHNNLNGTLSTRIGQLTNLVDLKLEGNKFTGTIPSELGTIGTLDSVWLSMNDFQGVVPKNLCGTSDLEADCHPSNTTQWTKIICSLDCCTYCCDPSGEYCY